MRDLPSLVALAHELKAPLGLIRHLALTRDYYNDEQLATALRRIELAAERALRLVETLSLTYRTPELDSEPINLNHLCQDIAHELTPMCRETNQPLELRLPRQSLLAVGNRDLLSSVVFGLCDNAFAYAGEQPIRLTASRQKNNARIAVSDQGPGLTKQQLNDMTARLGSAPQVMSNRPGSSGLGLYIASQFAEAMQGVFGIKQARSGEQNYYIDLPRSTQLSFIGV